jgi:O-antigen/teichoic acid export membrane protein
MRPAEFVHASGDQTGVVPRPAAPDESTARTGLRGHFHDPLYRTGYFLMAGTGITSLSGFAFWALAAHSYSAEMVGLSAAAISAMGLISGVCTLGLDAVLVRYLPTAGASARVLVLQTYAITAGLSLALAAGAALTAGAWSPSLRFLGDQGGWLVGFALATAAWTLFGMQDNVLTGLRSAQWVPLENSLYSIAKLAVLVALGGALPRSGAFIAWNAPVAPGVVLISVLIFRRLIPRRFGARAVTLPDRRRLVAAAAGNYGGMLCSMAGTLLLPVLVAAEADLRQAAFFYVPWMITTVPRLIAVNMTTSLTVEAALDERQLRYLSRRALVQTSRLVLAFVAVCGLGAPWVLRVFGADYADAGATLLRLFALAAIPNVIVCVAIAVARVKHNGRTVLAIQAAEGILMLGLSAILLPTAGIDGVGAAWLASQSVVAVALLAGTLRPLLLPRRVGADR